MKKIIYLSSIIAISAIISGCAKEENAETPTPQVKEQGTHTVVIHAVDGTKTAINEGETAQFVWTEDDKDRLTITENDNVGTIDDFSLSTGDELDKRILTFTASFSNPEQTPDNYVYKAVLASTDGDDNPIVPSEQTSDGSSYDPDADILVGTYESSGHATEFNLSFYRPVAVNKMTLKGLTAEETVKTIKITSNKPLTGTYNISEPSWTTTGNEIVISTNQAVSSEGQVTVFFTTMPVNSASLTIDVITQTSTATFFYKKQFAEGKTINFSPNLVTRFGVNNLNMTPAVAEVITGEERIGYATIDAAFDAANASETDCIIKLLADCSVSNKLSLNDSGSGKITLDLNGKTLSGPQGGTNLYTLQIINGREVTITDTSTDNIEEQGSIIGNTEASGHTVYASDATISIEGGKIISSASEKYSIYLAGTSSCSINKGRIKSENFRGIYSGANNTGLNISGGEFNCYDICLYNLGGKATISEGVFHSKNNAVVTSYGQNSKASVTNGRFSNETNNELFTILSSGKLYVTGGLCSKPVNSNRLRTEPVNNTYSYRCNAPNSDSSTMNDYPYLMGNYARNCEEQVKNGSTYFFYSIKDAAIHANNANNDVTLKMLQNTSISTTLELTNNNEHTITLNLNEKELSSSYTLIITTGKLEIEGPGIISSSYYYVVRVHGDNADVTINNCTIYSSNTNTTRETYVYPSAILLWDENITTGKTNSTLKISKSTIYTNNKLTSVSNRNGNLEIEDSEISSGVVSSGMVAVSTGDNTSGYTTCTPSTSIKSGVFYCSNNSSTRPAAYLYGLGGINISGGYFFSDATYGARANNSDNAVRVLITGGFFNKTLSTASTLKIQDGYSCIQLSSPEIKTHSIKGDLSFSYKVESNQQ